MSQERVAELLSYIMSAISNCALYSDKHPLISEFAVKTITVLDSLYVNDAFVFTLLGDSLVVNDTPIAEYGPHVTGFRRRLRKKGIEKIVFRKGVDPEEIRIFVAGMASSERVASSPHIAVGMIEVKFKAEGADISELMKENISKVREGFQGAAKLKRLDMVSLEDAVVGFVSTLKKETNILRIISPVKSYSEYTYVHATNVSVLTLFQAESLGLKGEILHDAGLAGLLHDVGKMSIPKEVLEKDAGLNQEEWIMMKQHPVHGAHYLSTLADVPKLSLIAAFEHHLKFDGSGYPDTKRRGKRQHIISQIIAISDFFDALRTERTYRKALDITATIELMKGVTGKDFNPLLVENFLGALKGIRAI